MKLKQKIFFQLGFAMAMLLPIVGHAQVMQRKVDLNLPVFALKRLELSSVYPMQDEAVEVGTYLSSRPFVSILFESDINPNNPQALASVVRCLDEACSSSVPVTTKNYAIFNAFSIYFPTVPQLGLYRVTLSGKLEDTEGKRLGEDLIWTFSVVENVTKKGPGNWGFPGIDTRVEINPDPGKVGDGPGAPGAKDSPSDSDKVEDGDPVGKNNVPGSTVGADGETGDGVNAAPQAAAMSGAGCSLTPANSAAHLDLLPQAGFVAFLIFSLRRQWRRI